MVKTISCRRRHAGRVLELTLQAPPGNILDRETMDAAHAALLTETTQPGLTAIVLRAAGEHFSYGASIQQHAPDRVAGLLQSFHRLVRTLLQAALPTVGIVRGQCLGGGMELISLCHWVFAAPDARFGQPEIRLGLFPPVASVVLPWRIGQPAADDLVLTGRSIDADEARRLGLVSRVDADPSASADRFLEEHVLGASATALHHAARAARHHMRRAVLADLETVERQYLEELMRTPDAREGIAAFLEKRSPRWQDEG